MNKVVFRLFLVSFLLSFIMFVSVFSTNGIVIETKTFDSVLVIKPQYIEFTFVSKNNIIEFSKDFNQK